LGIPSGGRGIRGASNMLSSLGSGMRTKALRSNKTDTSHNVDEEKPRRTRDKSDKKDRKSSKKDREKKSKKSKKSTRESRDDSEDSSEPRERTKKSKSRESSGRNLTAERFGKAIEKKISRRRVDEEEML
jgi:hypothetical protein